MSRNLIIGDPHEPCIRKGYLPFCKDMYEEWDCDTVIIIGDIADWASISFHLASPEGPGPTAEYDMAFKAIQKWHKAFPKAIVTIGNHDARPLRVAESVKIPRKFFRSYAEMWETPEWDWVQSVIIDNVLYRHGHATGGGKTAVGCGILAGLGVTPAIWYVPSIDLLKQTIIHLYLLELSV